MFEIKLLTFAKNIRNMRFLKNPNITVAILFIYTTCMYIYLFPRNQEMSDNEKWTIIGVSYAALVVLWFLLRRRSKMRREREEEMQQHRRNQSNSSTSLNE